MSELADRRCRPCEGGVPPLPDDEVGRLLAEVPAWTREGEAIARIFHFDDYYRTIAFVNAVAWIAHGAAHHPELLVGYNECTVRYWTHAVGGLTENDFICAARVDALLGG